MTQQQRINKPRRTNKMQLAIPLGGTESGIFVVAETGTNNSSNIRKCDKLLPVGPISLHLSNFCHSVAAYLMLKWTQQVPGGSCEPTGSEREMGGGGLMWPPALNNIQLELNGETCAKCALGLLEPRTLREGTPHSSRCISGVCWRWVHITLWGSLGSSRHPRAHIQTYRLACLWIVGRRQTTLHKHTQRTHKHKISAAQFSKTNDSSWPFLIHFNLNLIEILSAMHHQHSPLPSTWKPLIVEEFPALNVHSFNFFSSCKDSRMTSKKRVKMQ